MRVSVWPTGGWHNICLTLNSYFKLSLICYSSSYRRDRIIHHYKLPEVKVFGATAKFLACNQRITEVEKLLSCITTNNGTQMRDIDEILSVAINSACNCNEPEVKSALDNLVKRIHSVELRISCHIFIGQLKSAYLLANKYERIGDIRRILRQAELTNQVHIKKLCERKLFANAAARAHD